LCYSEKKFLFTKRCGKKKNLAARKKNLAARKHNLAARKKLFSHSHEKKFLALRNHFFEKTNF